MKKIFKNKKSILSIIIVFIVVALIASIFIDVSFAGTPLESSIAITSVNTVDIAPLKVNVIINGSKELNSIVWPERPFCWECGKLFSYAYLTTSNFIIRVGNDGIDTYNRKNGEVQNIFLGSHGNISAAVTDNEICFSYWQVDIGNWPIDTEDTGLYKYSFETGEIEKICDSKLENLTVINKHILFGTDDFWGIPKIVFIF